MIPHAIVTGASRGVGLSVTRLLLDRGYRVFAHYRTAPADLQHSRLTWWQADFLVPLDDAAPGAGALCWDCERWAGPVAGGCGAAHGGELFGAGGVDATVLAGIAGCAGDDGVSQFGGGQAGCGRLECL